MGKTALRNRCMALLSLLYGTWLAFQSCYLRYLSDELSVIVLFNQDYDETDICELAFEIAEIYQP
jgi:hypothetical protein